MSAVSDIYNLEAVVENSIQAVFTASSVVSFTTQQLADLQKGRPRVEIEYINGAGHERWIKVNGYPRETAWKGTVKLELITNADISIHSAYRTQIRSIMHGLSQTVNEVAPMTLHNIHQFLIDGGTSPKWVPQEGSYQTTMNFEINLSVQANAWAILSV